MLLPCCVVTRAFLAGRVLLMCPAIEPSTDRPWEKLNTIEMQNDWGEKSGVWCTGSTADERDPDGDIRVIIRGWIPGALSTWETPGGGDPKCTPGC